MTKNELITYYKTGREIEFIYKNKKYSLTYFLKHNKKYFSFCEFYKDTYETDNIDELWNASYNNEIIGNILLTIGENYCLL